MTLIPLEEYRPDREYDAKSCGHVMHPNGTVIDSLDRAFLMAAAREAVRLHLDAMRKDHT